MSVTVRPRLVVLPGGQSTGGESIAMRSPARRRLLDRALEFAVAFVPLIALAVVVQHFAGSVVFGDSSSRLTSARLALTGRDPHLAAIGFVWNPLPTLLALPFMPLSRWWPSLVTGGYAVIAVSSAATAVSAINLRRIAGELGLNRRLGRLLVAAFVLHPMTLLYAINGMSEALLISTLIYALRFLLRWCARRQIGDLVHVATGLALAYLCRYEALAPAAGATALVALISYRDAIAVRRERVARAAFEALIVGAPALAAFAAWAAISWSVTGHPFEHFSSEYGNTSQAAFAATGIDALVGGSRFVYVAAQIGAQAPWLALVELLALRAVRRRSGGLALLAPAAIFGSVCAFHFVFFLTGTTFGFLRFQIYALPFALVTAAALAQAGPLPRPRLPSWPMVAMTIAAFATGLTAMASPRLGREEHGVVRPLFDGRRTELDAFDAGHRDIARALEAAPGGGLIVIDHAHGFRIIQHLAHIDRLASTPDRDFEAIVADPVAFGVALIAVPEPEGYASTDASNRVHPTLFATGAGFAQLEREFPAGAGVRRWRIYRVLPD